MVLPLSGITNNATMITSVPNTCHHTLMSLSVFTSRTPKVLSNPWATSVRRKMTNTLL